MIDSIETHLTDEEILSSFSNEYEYVKTELFDEENLRKILTNKTITDKNLIRSLKHYNETKITVGEHMVKYKHTDLITAFNEKLKTKGNISKLLYGRLYGFTIGTLYNANIRNALAQKFYFDVDISNSHPKILNQYAIKHELDCPVLNKYVNNREETLAEIHSDRKVAKLIILISIYGGNASCLIDNETNSYNSTLDEFLREYKEEILTKIFLQNLQKELLKIAKHIFSEYSHYGDYKSKNDSKKINETPGDKKFYKLMSLYCQSVETNVMKFLDYALYKRYKRKFDLFIHDGGFILKKESEINFPEDILQWLSQMTLKKFQIDPELTQKPITFVLPQKTRDDNEYQEFKNSVENTGIYENGQFHKPIQGWIFFKVGPYYMRHFKGTDRFEQVSSGEVQSQQATLQIPGEKKSISFFSIWSTDKHVAGYAGMQFAPPPMLLTPNFFNTYRGLNVEFKIENNIIYQNLTFEECEEAIQPIIEYMNLLFENCAEFICEVLAKRFYCPGEKIPLFIIMRDEGSNNGGTGKSSFWDVFICEIIGKQFFHTVLKGERAFSHFNAAFENKFIINFDDADMFAIKKNINQLKSMITSETQGIEKKGKEIENQLTTAFYVCTTNNSFIYNPQLKRRFCVFDVNPCLKNNLEFKSKIQTMMREEIYQIMFFKYIKHKYAYAKDFSPIDLESKIPLTSAYVSSYQQTVKTSHPETMFLVSLYKNDGMLKTNYTLDYLCESYNEVSKKTYENWTGPSPYKHIGRNVFKTTIISKYFSCQNPDTLESILIMNYDKRERKDFYKFHEINLREYLKSITFTFNEDKEETNENLTLNIITTPLEKLYENYVNNEISSCQPTLSTKEKRKNDTIAISSELKNTEINNSEIPTLSSSKKKKFNYDDPKITPEQFYNQLVKESEEDGTNLADLFD